MIDVLGTAASIIAIMAVVIELIKHAKTFYRAKSEFDALQEQLEHFIALLKEIESQHATFNSPVVATSLSRANFKIEQLHQLIQMKILQSVNGTFRARRRAWTRNKSKICTIRDALKEYREIISTAISASSLSSARRSEATLAVINQDISHNKESALNIDRRLSEIHQAILHTQEVILSQPGILQHNLHLTSAYNRQLQSIIARTSIPGDPAKDFSGQLNYSLSSASCYVTYPIRMQAALARGYYQEEPLEDERKNDLHQSQNNFLTSEPASPFEVSSNFLPETYAIDQRLQPSSLILTSSKQVQSSLQSRINCYTFLYLKSRRCLRLGISIEFSSSSTYWRATQLPRYERIFPPSLVNRCSECYLPQSLLQKIKEYLSRDNEYSQNTNIRLCLSTEDNIQKNQIESQLLTIPFKTPMMATKVANMTQTILDFLDDLGCQHFVESQVIKVDMIEPPIRFASLVNGMLVCEVKIFGDRLRYKDLYNIQVLNGMNGVPGFAKLVGIVVDNHSRRHLKSYLVEIPQSKWNFISDQVTVSSEVPWERRENWARQVVEGVQQIHSKSFVIGTLWRNRQPIIIDNFDRVYFWTFDKQFVPHIGRSCCYPPEYTCFLDNPPTTNEAEFPNITPKADIFLLGMALWYLAIGYPVPRFGRGPLTEKEQLTVPHEFQRKYGSFALPPLPESIPKYYRDVVNECRSVNPHDRPSAWRLLERFPPRKSYEPAQSEALGRGNVELSLTSMKNAFKRRIWCEYCWNGVKENYFHCDVCLEGDFDICSSCYGQGRHCYDATHLLIEFVEIQSNWTTSKRYHAVARNMDSREIIEL